jgi:hypothetical protein
METKAKLNVVSKDDKKAIALDILKRYPKAQKVSVASDGQAFITDDGDAAAKNHSKVNIYGKELELSAFTRDGLTPSTGSGNLKKADELIAEIKAATTVEQVAELLAGDTRTTVVAAAEKQIKNINTPA